VFRQSILTSIGHSLNSDQIDHLARQTDSSFDLGRVSGFGTSIRVPQQVAVQCVSAFFSDDRKLLAFLAEVLLSEGTYVGGSQVALKGKAALLELLELESWKFDRDLRQFVRDQAMERTADWGFMIEGREYHLSFVSLDVVGSSEFKAKDQIFSALRDYVKNYAEVWNGRLWHWMGDGGMLAFHGSDGVNRCAISMISILMNLPVFNMKYLPEGPELRLRIGMHYGTATYKKPVNEIFSTDMRTAQRVESEICPPNRLAITSSVYTFLKPELYAHFKPGPALDRMETHILGART
jgi:class 3 adenylate cyclase